MDIEDIGNVGHKRKLPKIDSESSKTKAIKTEPTDTVDQVPVGDVSDQILTVLANYPSGIKENELRQMLPQISGGVRVKAINTLLADKKIELFTAHGKDLVYKLRDDGGSVALKDANVKEQIVYEIIRQSGNKGIWHRDIRAKSNLMQQEVTKILKNLETRSAIKSVKLASANKKKLYMLSNLEPDSSITGGVWFANEEYDAEFVEVVTQQCHRYLQQKAAAAKYCFDKNPLKFHELAIASPADICQFLHKLGLAKVELAPSDVERLMDALVYEGEVEKRSMTGTSRDANQVYYTINPNKLTPRSDITSPCLRCPVKTNCRSFGRISPLACPYLSNIWTYCKHCGDNDNCEHMKSVSLLL